MLTPNPHKHTTPFTKSLITTHAAAVRKKRKQSSDHFRAALRCCCLSPVSYPACSQLIAQGENKQLNSASNMHNPYHIAANINLASPCCRCCPATHTPHKQMPPWPASTAVPTWQGTVFQLQQLCKWPPNNNKRINHAIHQMHEFLSAEAPRLPPATWKKLVQQLQVGMRQGNRMPVVGSAHQTKEGLPLPRRVHCKSVSSVAHYVQRDSTWSCIEQSCRLSSHTNAPCGCSCAMCLFLKKTINADST